MDTTKEKLEELLRIATEDSRFITEDKSKKLISTDYPLEKLMYKICSLSNEEKKKINDILSIKQKIDILEKLFLNYLYNITPLFRSDGFDIKFGDNQIQEDMKMINKFKTENIEKINECFYKILTIPNIPPRGCDVWRYMNMLYEYTSL